MCLALLDGKIHQAFRYNSIMFIDIPVIFIAIILERIFKENKIVKKVINAIYIVLLIITIIYGVLRNIPYFSFLAPTDI